MAKRFNPLAIIIGAPLLTFAGLALYKSSPEKDEPVSVYAHREPQGVRAAPYEAVQQGAEVSLEVLANKNSPWLTDGLNIRLSGNVASEASRSAPVYTEISNLAHRTVSIQMQQGQYAMTDMFNAPQDLDAKTLRLYCTDPSTKQPKLLHTSTFRKRQ
jgi:hypothetical protein